MADLSKLAGRRTEGLGRGSSPTTSADTEFKGRSATILVGVFRFGGIGAGDIGQAITRHRGWRRRVGELAQRRRQRRDWFRIIAPLVLASAVLLERFAWRRLLHMRAWQADDARQKVLYLMSVSIADGVALTSRDINLINASLLGFEMELASLLKKADRR